jgi:hypothetical protein
MNCVNGHKVSKKGSAPLIYSPTELNNELTMWRRTFFRAVGLSAAVCYLEARAESGYIWKQYKQKLRNFKLLNFNLESGSQITPGENLLLGFWEEEVKG